VDCPFVCKILQQCVTVFPTKELFSFAVSTNTLAQVEQ